MLGVSEAGTVALHHLLPAGDHELLQLLRAGDAQLSPGGDEDLQRGGGLGPISNTDIQRDKGGEVRALVWADWGQTEVYEKTETNMFHNIGLLGLPYILHHPPVCTTLCCRVISSCFDRENLQTGF